MDIIQGGYRSVEVASDETFADAKTITQPLKAGTFLQMKTDELELADGKKYSEVKRLDLGIRSANVDLGEGSVYAFIKAAEEAKTTLAFRFYSIRGVQAVIKNVLAAVTYEFSEIKKFCAVNISGMVMGATESDIIAIYSYRYLKIDSEHYLKIDSMNYLRIS